MNHPAPSQQRNNTTHAQRMQTRSVMSKVDLVTQPKEDAGSPRECEGLGGGLTLQLTSAKRRRQVPCWAQKGKYE